MNELHSAFAWVNKLTTVQKPEPSPCSNCKDKYWPEDLIWADTGGLRWLCQECYDAERASA
jgi:hypothetical protein